MKYYTAFTLFVLSFFATHAQNTFTLRGVVKDKQSGEPLVGATFYVPAQKKGGQTDGKGNFILQFSVDTFTAFFRYTGYKTEKVFLDFKKKDSSIESIVVVLEEGLTLGAVTIESDNFKNRVDQTQMGLARLDIETIKQLPALFGEVDVLKVLQLLPGIKSGTEGTSGFFVRGGTNDQNLVLLDGTVVYNPAHMGGLFSVFNPEAVAGLDAYKGNFPAHYGGRLSSVIAVEMREGNTKKFSGSGGIGLISSRLTLEIPFEFSAGRFDPDGFSQTNRKNKKQSSRRDISNQNKKGSLLISGRRTYFDVFTRAYNRLNEGNKDFNPIPDYYFYDFNVKSVYQIDPNNRVTVTAYLGNDKIGFKDERFSFDFAWRNIVASLNWGRVFKPNLYGSLTVSYTRYDYQILNQFSTIRAELTSQISDYTIKYDLRYLPHKRHTLRGGGQYILHSFNPSRLNAGSSAENLDFKYNQELQGGELGVYLSDEYTMSRRWKADVGLRASGYIATSKNYFNIEPRASVRFKINDSLSFKASYARMAQYVHLAQSSTITLPTDIWYPSTNILRPQTSDIVAVGATWLLKPLGLLLTNEWYYKWLHNQVEYRENAQIFFNPQLDKELVFGSGRSYGSEWLLERKSGKTTGWIGYTLSWTDRQFPDLNGGARFPFRYDRRHDFSIVLSQKISKRIIITATFIYRSGEAITLPNSRFALHDLQGIRQVGLQRDAGGAIVGFDPGLTIPQYVDRNSFRMPAYHRADINFTYKFRPKWGTSDINISIYNVYNRANPFFLYFEEEKNEQKAPVRFVGKIVSLFPILPSIAYNFHF